MPSKNPTEVSPFGSERFWTSAVVCVAFLCAVGNLRAQGPEIELQEYVHALVAARNYSWLEKQILDFDSRGAAPRARLPAFATGQAGVGGFTVASVQRRGVVQANGRIAFQLPGGSWRHADDLTDEDLEALGYKLPGMDSSSNRTLFARSLSLALPHEVLERLLQKGKAIRKVGISYEGELAGTLDEEMELQSLLSGHPRLARPEVARARLVRPSSPSKSNRPNYAEITFVVWVENNVVSEFSVYIKRRMNISLAGDPPESHLSTTEYYFKVTDVGSTTVTVPPEAEAVLSVR